MWEDENINFTLLDEDGDPLPNILEEESVNRLIHYQIINGKNVFGSQEASLSDGKLIVEHQPAAFGFETCTIFHEGSRFFAPSEDRDKALILRRPLILNFTDFRHDNPNRREVPHSGHRGESIIVEATVQDYLNQLLVSNHEVFLGYDGKVTRESGVSDEFGNVSFEVSLIKIELIQAGSYVLNLKIYSSKVFESARVEHQEDIYIFEIGHVNFSVGDISTEGMNYIFNPVIRFYDEDNKLLTSTLFYIEVININTQKVIFLGDISSGEVSVAIYNAGKYEIRFTIDNTDVAKSGDINSIANFYLSQILIIATSSVSEDIEVKDEYLNPFYSYPFSEIVAEALWTGIYIGAKWLTLAILWIIFAFTHPPLEIEFTFGMIIKSLLLFFILQIFLDFPINPAYMALVATSLHQFVVNFHMALIDTDWMYHTTLLFIDSVVLGFILVNILISEPPDKPKWKHIAIVTLIELPILFLISFFNVFWKSVIPRPFVDMLDGALIGMWSMAHFVLETWGKLFSILPMATALYILLIAIIVYAVVGMIVIPFVDLMIPEHEGIFKTYYRALKEILINSISLLLLGFILVILSPLSTVIQAISQIVLEVIFSMIFEVFLTQLSMILFTDFINTFNIPQKF